MFTGSWTIIDVLDTSLEAAFYAVTFSLHCTDREFCDMKLDELNDLEDEIDEEDERIFEAYRLQ